MENGNLICLLDEYKIYLKDKKRVSVATLSAYATDLRKFNTFAKDKYQIEMAGDLNPSILMSYLLNMKSAGKASSSISRSMSVIKNFAQYCYQEQYTDENLADCKLEIPKDEKKLPEILTVEEVNILLSQPENTALGIRDKAMLEILYTSGLKVNELINLKVHNIDLKLKVLKCQKDSKIRILPLGAIAYDAIVDYLFNSRNTLNKADCDYLFLSYNGQKISRQGFWKVVKKYAAQAGFNKNISTSTFRHSFATHMIQNGIHRDALKDALGNSSVASVQMYLDLNRKRQQSN